MSTIAGSGKWIKIQNGTLSFGKDSTTYGNAYAYSVTQNNVVYKGMYAASMSYLDITGVSELSIGDAQGYTGTIRMYTDFNDPYDVVIWDPNYDISRITRTYKTYRFIHGFMVGEA